MKIKPEYSICYDEDDICIVRRGPDGKEESSVPLTASAAMAIEGFARGADKDAVIDTVMNEFGVRDREAVAADLDRLMAQLLALGYAEE